MKIKINVEVNNLCKERQRRECEKTANADRWEKQRRKKEEKHEKENAHTQP